jgi:AAA domain, putative AbiEii toxin, Type IV TA system
LYVKSLNIYNFRCFAKASMTLQYPGRPADTKLEMDNVNLLLGANGEGKSSVLRALAIATLAPVLGDSGFVPYRLVRRIANGRRTQPAKSLLKVRAIFEKIELLGHVAKVPQRQEIDLLARVFRGSGNNDRLTSKGTPKSPLLAHLHDDASPSFFVVGYGATRRVEAGEFSPGSRRKERGVRYERVASLFEDHVTLRPLTTWLPHLKSRTRTREVVTLLNAILPENLRFAGKLDRDGEFLFEFESEPTPFPALADGYRAFIGWVGDLLAHLCDVAPPRVKLNKLPGLVLVDEIDLHLHPEWQRTVVPSVARVFPHLQFALTSHSPLIVGTLRRENVFVIERSPDGDASIAQYKERVHGLSSEQLLLSSYFGLTSTRAPDFEDHAKQLFDQAASGNREAALHYLDQLSRPDDSKSLSNSAGASPASKPRRGVRAAKSVQPKKQK